MSDNLVVKLTDLLETDLRFVDEDSEMIGSLDYDTGGISKAVNWQVGGDFVFCELRKHNEQWMERIQTADSAIPDEDKKLTREFLEQVEG